MGFEGGDDEPIGTVLDVGNEDLAVPQTRGFAAGNGTGRVGADLLDDGLARGTRDGQDRGGRVLAHALLCEGADTTEARLVAGVQEIRTGRRWLNEGAVAIDVTDPVLSRVLVSGDHASLRKRAAEAAQQLGRQRRR